MQDLVAEACSLIHSLEGVRGVHIVAAARPTYRQLRRFRQVARRDHVHLRVDRDGVITIRHEGG